MCIVEWLDTGTIQNKSGVFASCGAATAVGAEEKKLSMLVIVLIVIVCLVAAIAVAVYLCWYMSRERARKVTPMRTP